MSLNAYAIVSAGVRCLHFRQDLRAMHLDCGHTRNILKLGLSTSALKLERWIEGGMNTI